MRPVILAHSASDLYESVARITRCLSMYDEQAFASESIAQDAVRYNLLVIEECLRAMDAQWPDIRPALDAGTKPLHQYLGLWDFVQDYIPRLTHLLSREGTPT